MLHVKPVAAGLASAFAGSAEWQTRLDLAAAYRLAHHFGWTDLIYNHITAKIPGAENEFLINPMGLMYDEVTASNLVKIDLDGTGRKTDDWRMVPALR